MNLDILINTITKAYGLQVLIVDEKTHYSSLDYGIRKLLNQSVDATLFYNYFNDINYESVIFQSDIYNCNYIIFKLNKQIVCMGPFLETRPSKAGLDAILKRNNIVIKENSDKLMILYRSLPIISDYIPFHNLVFDIIKYHIPNLKQVHAHEFNFDTSKASANYIPIGDDQRMVSDAMFLERYRVENKLMEAVSNGNLEEALMYNNRFRALTTEYQHFTDLSMVSAYLMSFNTLLRKAIDKAGVHPIFIEHISSQFTKKILTHDFDSTLNSTFLNEMITTYVTSVNEFTYRNLSPLIKDVTKKIDTHISDRLAINELADKFNVSTTYLSTRFKNEHNITITEFINRKRLMIAKRMLSSSNLPIIEIAMECGFQDQNYFARVFKKAFGITPSQYRSHK